MKRRILVVIGFLLLILLTSFGLIFTHNANEQSSLAKCYYGSLQKDQVLLRVDSQLLGNINGYLNYAFFEKDNSKGEFTGTLKGNKLTIDYAFQSEGVLSHRPVIFLKNGNLLSGDGFVLRPTSKCEVIKY